MSIRITTLGSLAVTHGGIQVPGLPTGSLRCALLVYLAVEGEVSRDVAMEMFWPGKRPARARHSLNQAVYQLRNALGATAVETHGELLRIGRTVTVDARELEQASLQEDPVILELYGGPFLAEDPLPVGGPFAAWIGRRRARYADIHRLARRRRIQALLDAGEDLAALESAREWVQLEPEATEPREQLDALLTKPAVGVATPRPGRAVPVPSPGSVARGRGVLVAVLLACAAVAVWVVADPSPNRDTTADVDPEHHVAGPDGAAGLWGAEAGAGARLVGVVPFAGLGSPPDSSSVLQTAFASAVEWLPRWRAVEAASLAPLARAGIGERAVSEAERLGLSYLITGRVGDGPGRPGLEVSAWSVPSGVRVYRGRAHGGERPGDASARLSYELMHVLAAIEAVPLPLPRGVHHETGSTAARGHFMHGRWRMGRHEWREAGAAFRRAAEVDSMFTHAWLRAGLAYVAHDPEVALGLAERGARIVHDSAGPGALLLEGLRALALRDAEEAIAVFRAAAAADPESPDAWYGLAMSLHHLAGPAGRDSGGGAAMAAFRRLLALDPGYAAYHHHAFDLAVAAGDPDAAAAALEAGPVAARAGAEYRARRLVLSLLEVGGDARVVTLDSLRWRERDTLTEVAASLLRGADHLALVDTLGIILQGATRTPSDRRAGARLRLLAMAGSGRMAGVREVALELDDQDPLRLLAELSGVLGAPAALSSASGNPAGSVQDADVLPDFTLPVEHPDRVRFRAEATRAAVTGDSALVGRLLRRVRRRTGQVHATDPIPGSIEASLLARQALLASDTTAAIAHLRGAIRRPAWPHLWRLPLTCMAPQRMLLNKLLRAQGGPEQEAPGAGPEAVGCPADHLFRHHLQ